MDLTKRVYIIAEAGVNHNGDLELAKRLIDVASDAGADAVKFQTFKTENLVGTAAPKADYQVRAMGSTESQYAMLNKLELDENAHDILMERCRQRGIQFLSTPFDRESVDLLVRKLNLPIIKIPSGELTNAPLLLYISQTKKPVIVSTGMCTLGEVENALSVLAYGYTVQNRRPDPEAFAGAYYSFEGQTALREKVVLLHCTTEYPAPFGDVHLRAMGTLRSAFDLPVGLSDHTPGVAVSIAASALGATIIEKHFTVDRNLPGPDQKASLEPDELKRMIQSIREVETALGREAKLPAPSELKNKAVARKSLVAACDIRKGEPFTEENMTTKRPGNGISPFRYWEWLGKVSDRDYKRDELIVE